MYDNMMDDSPATEKPRQDQGALMSRFMQAQQNQPGGAKSGAFSHPAGSGPDGQDGQGPMPGMAGRAGGGQPMGMPGMPKPPEPGMAPGMPPKPPLDMMGKPDPRRFGLMKKPVPYSWS